MTDRPSPLHSKPDDTLRWLAARAEFARAVHAAPDLDAVLDAALAQAVARLGARHAMAFLATEVGGRTERDADWAPIRATELRATAGTLREEPERFPLLVLLGERAGAGRVLVQVADLSADPAVAPLAAEAAAEAIAAFVDLPLETQGRYLGHWALFYAQPHRCTPPELEALLACAEHLATAVIQALRLDELVSRTRRLSITYEIGRELNSRLDLPQALRGILEACVRAVQADDGSLVAFDASGATLAAWRLENGVLGETPVDRVQLVLEQGLAGWVVRQREAAFVPDTSRDPRWLHKPGAPARSALCLPLLHGDEVVGIMTLSHPRVNAFTRDDLDLLAAVADQAALAVENARLYRAAEARAQRLTILNEVTRSITSTLDLDSVLDLIMSKTLEILEAEAGSLVLIEGPQRDLVFRVTRGAHAEQVAGRRLPWGTGLTGQVAADGRPIISNDVRSDPRWFGRTDDAGFIRQIMILPLLSRGTVIGVLTGINKHGAEGFSQRDIELISAFADQAAIAVENARLFGSTDEALAERVNELSALETITREIASTLDLHHVIDVLLKRALAVTRAPRGFVALARDAGGLDVVVAHGFDGGPVAQSADIAAAVMRAGDPLVLEDVRGAPEGAAVDPARALALLCLPIVYERRVLGAIQLEADEPGGLDEADARFVAQLADHAALAIQNARLFAEVTRVRDRLQTVLNSASDGIAMFDPAGSLVLVNPAMCALMGVDLGVYTRPGGPTLSFDELHARLGLPEHTLARVSETLQAEIGAVVRLPFQVEGVTRRYIEELVVPVYAALPEIGASGGELAAPLLVVWYDVTEQKELEQTREEFTHMLVHDLRSPLGAVIGGLSLAQESLETPDGFDAGMIHETVDLALDGARHLLDMINRILDISKLESGTMPLEIRPVAPAELAEDVVRTLRGAADTAGIALTSEVPADLPAVPADYEKIQRVLVNLVGNALKFTPAGKRVTLRAALSDEAVTLMVADEGPGIPEEYRTRIFEKFVQVPGRRGRQKGTGLGLAFCKLTVEAHSGRIWVECPPEGGSVFHFTLLRQ